MDKTLTGTIGVLFAMIMLVAIPSIIEASTPQPQYICPVCGEGFYTYDELYQHFITEHQDLSIELIGATPMVEVGTITWV